MKIKIKSWEELNEIKNIFYRLQYVDKTIEVRPVLSNCLILEANTKEVSREAIISILEIFGFSVEFEELPKLSKKANNFVWGLDDDAWIAVDADGMVWVYRLEPYRCLSYTEWHCAHDDGYELPHREPNLLFPFITWETRAWSVKELRELEVEDDD